MTNKISNVLHIVKKVFWGIVWAIFGLVALVAVWLAVDKFVVGNPVPSVFGYSTLTIATGSMNGTSVMVQGQDPVEVNIGDMIVIKKTNDYKVGDVVTFLHDGEKVPTTHRIIGYTDDGFVTKGDANNVKDTVPVAESEVIGEVVAHLPKAGLFAEWVQKEGWLYIVCVLAIVAIGSLILNTQDDPQTETVANGDDNAASGDDTTNDPLSDNNDLAANTQDDEQGAQQ